MLFLCGECEESGGWEASKIGLQLAGSTIGSTSTGGIQGYTPKKGD